jgi:DNA-directed RNA polymerase subunit beta'
VTRKDTKKSRSVIVTNEETGETKEYPIPYGSRIKPTDGQVIEAGDALTEGSVNPHDLLEIKGVRAVEDYLLHEVQKVYRQQGVDICDKHIEVIVRSMLKKVRIEEQGDSRFLPGSLVDVLDFEDENEELSNEGKQPAVGKRIILGITKAALATDSFLSAASFQETTKVLTDAAIRGKIDPLLGLKENIIIGKLIPAGTGMKRYRYTKLNTDERIAAAAAAKAASLSDDLLPAGDDETPVPAPAGDITEAPSDGEDAQGTLQDPTDPGTDPNDILLG